jgi:zinc finger HIT domain-containing protein 1
MPLVEVLPNTGASHVTPGWAYVPDPIFTAAVSTGAAESTHAIKSGRKRGIRGPGTAGGRGRAADLTARQQTAILRHLAELDRENHRDVHVPVPAKSKEREKDAARGSYFGVPWNRFVLHDENKWKSGEQLT